MGTQITEEQISDYLKIMQAVLNYSEKVHTDAYKIIQKWYKLYEKNYKWYWGFKLSYEKFVDKLSDEYHLRTVINQLGYNVITTLENTELCDSLDIYSIKKYTALDNIQRDVNVVLKALEVRYKYRSFIYKVNDCKEHIIRYNVRYNFDTNYQQMIIACDEFIEKYKIKIEN